MDTPAVFTSQLTKLYGDTVALDQLDLSVSRGAVHCLLGPNGSGKTTTVAILTTLRTPTGGTAQVDGIDVVSQPDQVRARCGVTLQHTGVDQQMTGREVLRLQAVLQGLGRTARSRRVDNLVELLDLSGHIDTRISGWSGGLRRRLDLAAALVHRPSILFLDEPTTGLDPASRRTLWDEIERLNREEGTTVFLTTQYLEEAERLAETVSILRAGRLIITSSPNRLKHGLGERRMVLRFAHAEHTGAAAQLLGGSVDMEGDQPILRVPVDAGDEPRCLADLAHAGCDVVAFTVVEPSLEDVFLRLTAEPLEEPA
jgi:ABC-2 type transport system ATP-binding protein